MFKNLLNKICEKVVIKKLSGFENESLVIENFGRKKILGDKNVVSKELAPSLPTLKINSKEAFKKLFFRGGVGLAESYAKGMIEITDLYKTLCFFCNNISNVSRFEKINFFYSLVSKIKFLTIQKNSVKKSKKNILDHYDISNDFFKLFLDETMMYSSAIFSENETNLYNGSLKKIEKICDLAKIEDNQDILEIGSGWGAVAGYIATNHPKSNITTTTISDEQYSYNQKLFNKISCNNITLLNKDYRKLSGKYDRLISIEMIEAVGHQYFKSYFKKCDSLLKDDGIMVIQAITINHKRYEKSKNKVDFIKKYIFPGGCLPSLEKIAQICKKHTNLEIFEVHDITDSYVKTLLLWAKNFNKNLYKIEQLGYSEEFIKIWEFYFYYCAAGFNSGYIRCKQICLKKISF